MARGMESRPRNQRTRPAGGNGPRSAVTIREVAESAGVSTATVSRVFAEPRGRVSSATRRRVMRAAQELGYRPHRGARALARQRSDLVGVLLLGFGAGFVGDVMDGIAEAARQTGRDAVFATYGARGHDGLRRALEHLLEARPEGIVFYPATSLPIDDKLLVDELMRVPTVLVDLSVEGLEVPLVASDDASGIRQALEYLLSLGHERIGHLAGPEWMSTGAVRLRAFREGMAEHGLPVPSELVVAHDYTYSEAVTAAQRLLQATPLPTAVIAADDKAAAAVLSVARHLGLAVPDDLSVIGYSDSYLCQSWYPPLTTVRQSKEELGREAIRLLEAMIEGDESAQVSGVHLLPTQLVVRGSCGRHAGRLRPAPPAVVYESSYEEQAGRQEAPMP
ncbi:MAG: LacI family DNA-binding transcriptional regulator [Armatimonadota bacterium]